MGGLVAPTEASQRGLLRASVTSSDTSKQPGYKQVKNPSFSGLSLPVFGGWRKSGTLEWQETVSQFKTPKSRR